MQVCAGAVVCALTTTMLRLDLSFLQRTDPRMEVHPEVRAALMSSDRSDRFELRAILSGAFADPAAFLRDEPVQRAFLELIGRDRAGQLMRAYRHCGTTMEASLSTMLGANEQSLYAVLAFSRNQLMKRRDGTFWIEGSESRPGVDVNPRNVSQILMKLRRAAYDRREVGLPRNVLNSARVDLWQGHVEILDNTQRDELDLNRDALSNPQFVYQGEHLNIRDMFAPDIGVRILGERQLGLIASEMLRVLTRMGGEERRADAWSYQRSIEAVIRIHCDAGVDATPFIEETFDQLMEEDMLDGGQKHLVIATYYDHLLSHLDRKLQMLAKIMPNRNSAGTVDGLIYSLSLAMDSNAMPDELLDDEALAETFVSSRARLKELLGNSHSVHVIREIVHEYLNLYDDKGLVWFLGQTLPLVAFFSDAESFRQNGIDVVRVFSPNAHYGWNSYATVMEQVRSIINPGWSDPDGGERMIVVSADMPMSADSFGYGMLPGPGTVNHAALCARGGILMAG